MSSYIGIDGCRGGWVFSELHNNKVTILYFKELNDGFEMLKKSSCISIDMPMGLISSKDEIRDCDILVRKELGHPYCSSVFSVPCLQAIYSDNFKNANRINREILGKGISIQCWNIFKKIRELDSFIKTHPFLKEKMFECHPELVFKVLNKDILTHKKKTIEGKTIRLYLLQNIIPNTKDAIALIRKHVLKKIAQDDDLLDSMVLSYNAKQIHEEKFLQLPTNNTFNNNDIRMNIRVWNGR